MFLGSLHIQTKSEPCHITLSNRILQRHRVTPPPPPPRPWHGLLLPDDVIGRLWNIFGSYVEGRHGTVRGWMVCLASILWTFSDCQILGGRMCVCFLIPTRKTAMEKLVPSVHGAIEKWLLRGGSIFDRKCVVWKRKLKLSLVPVVTCTLSNVWWKIMVWTEKAAATNGPTPLDIARDNGHDDDVTEYLGNSIPSKRSRCNASPLECISK